MSLDAGFDAQVPSLPQGGGAMSGLGETFSADISTGTGTYRIPLDIPNGPNDIAPRLSLVYCTANGSGAFGMGFALSPLPRLIRSTAQGFPSYDETDVLMLEGVGELARLAGGAFRPRVDAGAWRASASGDGFEATSREGLVYAFGIDPAARLTGDGADANKVFAWHLQRIEDALGNTATFTWTRDANQLYLASVAYGAYLVAFVYEARPDPVRWGRAGFPITTARRCAAIELRMPGAAQPLVRRWKLTYSQAPANQCSLLTECLMSGFGEDGTPLDAPPLRLGYTAFKPRELARFGALDEGATPGPLTRPARRVDLVDWNANGLPDLLEVEAGGVARVWPNLGDCTWGRPQQVADLPQFAAASAPIAFADMDGDGLADLLRLDRPIGGYIPRTAGAGFGRPVTFERAPALSPGDAHTRLADLNGDGLVDLIASSDDYLSLSFRSDPDGWDVRPQVVPRGIAPDVDLADPHVFLADMTGDGSPDIVRVSGAGVTYWPYLGPGKWDASIVMENPPELPFDVDARRLFLTDLDGDGCADLLYLGEERVQYWMNRAGGGFGSMRAIEYVPTGQIADARIADMRGSGTAGILWSAPGALGHGTAYFYLDFTGDAKPYLLETIDNGVGKLTRIGYTSSAREAAADAQRGTPWATTLPAVIPVIASIGASDAATGRFSLTRYRYHDGRFDGVLREFAGFGRVDEDQIGDATAPTLRTTNWFHIGVDPADPGAQLTADQRRSLRAIRGRLYRQERYGLDGSPKESLPYDRLEQTWVVASEATSGGPVDKPRLTKIVRSTIERNAAAAATLTTENLSFDANGNVTESVQTSEEAGHPERTQVLRTQTTFAVDPTGRFVAKVSRVRQSDGAARIVADTITEYDGVPEGQVGPQGLITRRTALVLDDALVAEVYGAQVPDFAALGYVRRAGETGWWALQASYRRIVDGTGLHGEVASASGAVTRFDFDANQTFPGLIRDALGNVTAAEHDYRVCRVKRLTDTGGFVYEAAFDALARPRYVVEPGDTAALPTHDWVYGAALPVEATLRRRAESGKAAVITTREFFDGDGKLLERRLTDDGGELIAVSNLYDGRGHLSRTYLERRPPSGAYAPPDDTLPHVTYEYDSLGRLTRQTNADGSVRTRVYDALVVDDYDEEDNRTGSGATHSGTPTRKHFFATGQVRAIEESLGGYLVTSTYEYDVKGNLVKHADAMGHVTTFVHDLLGRTLRVVRPERATFSVFDADGNAVEARGPDGTLVVREFDALKRPLTVRYLDAAHAPAIRFTYHNADGPAPADAGAHTLGHLVRVDDEGGTTVFDYDDRGRTALKRSTPMGAGRSFDLRIAYRADGQWSDVTYPDGTAVTYGYNARGAVQTVSGIVSGIDYDLAGRRTAIRYANGTESKLTYDPATGRLRSSDVGGPADSSLRQTAFTTDLVGNLLRIDSPDPTLAATYAYDDLYRLTQAGTDSGETLTCHYDDAGNLTFKSDIGDYRYGEGGFPATCLTSAGAQRFTYTALGEMRETSWGVQTFDPMGRLTRLAAADGSGAVDFTYDFAGNRVTAKSSGSAPSTDRITPDPLYAIESGHLVVHFFDGVSVCARRVEGGPIAFLHTDPLGSLVMVTDATGAVSATVRYDAFGAVRARTGAGAGEPVGFTGGTPEAFSGLLYLNARYYNPALGRFVSPDACVQDALDPAAWASYTYCRNNPTSYVDPSGRSFWGIFLAALAIVALIVVVAVCVVADVFSAGTLTPALAIGIVALGSVVGGVVGGLAANAKHGNAEDIITGVLVGAAVGGWAAFASLFAGGAVAGGAFHLSAGSFGFGVVAGAVNGAINGAAIGFAAGYAGGKGSLDEILTKVWQGALIGLVTGAVIGGLSNVIKPPSDSLVNSVRNSLQPQAPTAAPSLPGAGAGGGIPVAPPGYTTSFGTAVTNTATGIGARVGGAVAMYAAQTVLSGPAAALIGTLAVDTVAGAWDLGYVPWILNRIGVVKAGGSF